MLLLLRANEMIKTPEDWLFMQLNGLYAYLPIIWTYLKQQYPVSSVDARLTINLILQMALNILHCMNSAKFICFVDESNILLKLHESKKKF